MTISIIRHFTTDDQARLNAAANRFALRHSVNVDCIDDNFWRVLDAKLDWQARYGEPKLFRLWQRVLCRALRVPQDSRTTVAYGYVGFTVA